MEKRFGQLFSLALVLILVFLLAGCEKDRPVPTPVGAGGTQTPAANGTAAPGRGVAGQATPVPAGAAASAAASPAPGSASAGTTQTGTGGSGDHFIYTVAAGDTLAKIARKFNVTPESIINLNYLADPDVVTLGQQLKIPGQAPSGDGNTYVVKSGETLYSIASRFGVTVAEMQKLNNISDPDQVQAGETLKIPEKASAPATGQGKTYVVQRGDTLFSIAVKHGVTTAALLKENSISDADQIRVGQVLNIP